jgi:hypothetical protein
MIMIFDINSMTAVWQDICPRVNACRAEEA